MKRRKWLQILLILAFLTAFIGYRDFDAARTDREPPKLTMDDSQILQLSVQDSREKLLQGITAQDSQSGDVSDTIVVEDIRLTDESGMIEVSYAAADDAGNVVKATRQAQYVDYVSPKFTLNAPMIYTYGESFDVLSNVGASDVLDGDIQHRIRATALSEKSISDMGTHFVHFQVSNSLGDTSELAMPVEIQSPNSFDAHLTLKNYLIYLPLGSSFQPKEYLKDYFYRDEEFSLENGLPEDFSLKTTGQVLTDTPGVYSVEYRVTYTVRHETNPDFDQKYTGYSKLIVVVEG